MFLLQTHYDILGIAPTANNEQIKSAFRKLAKLFHPDKNPGGKEQFEKILVAYEVLIDSAKRRQYDLRLKGYSTASSSSQKTQTKSGQKQWGFSDEELKRRQYYQEHYKKEYSKYTNKQTADARKTAYNEYKYILFATPLAVALFMLVIKGFEDNRPAKKEIPANAEAQTQEIKMGADPYTLYFKNPVYDTIANRTLVIKNLSGKDAIVNLFGKQNKFLRSCVVKTGFFVELEQLPDILREMKMAVGKNWNGSKVFKNLEVIGGFESENKFYKIDIAKTNGWTISVDDELLEVSESINEKEFFKKD